MKKSGRIKAKKRTPAETARIYGSEAHVEWMKRRPCWNCGRWAGPNRSIAIAHISNGGTGRKDDAARTIPLCETVSKKGCHDAQHAKGWSVLTSLATKEQRKAAAAITEEDWQLHLSGQTP